MATYREILAEKFPAMDLELLHYVEGVLDNGAEDFENSDEVFEAIGEVLQEVTTGSREEAEIRNICEQLLNALHIEYGCGKMMKVTKVLNAPIQLGKMAEEFEYKSEEVRSIWLQQRDNTTQVDQKKLEKAEAKLRQKQDKRGAEPTTAGQQNGFMIAKAASANQAINRKDTKMDAKGSNRTNDIKIENFDIAFGNKVLLQGADISLVFGRRYGLVGRNGIGKTTLLRMISSKQLLIPSHISILHVEQEVIGDDTIALQSVLQSDIQREQLMNEERHLNTTLNSTVDKVDSSLNARLSEIYHQLESMEADKAPAKASVILAGLGFSAEMQAKCTREFSGGWRMRLALARALFAKPDLLLLDEPTNMLDMKAIIWLENYLQTWLTTILVVSHDRNFLDSVATDILHMHSQRIDSYRGNYDNFVKTKTEKLKNQQREYEAQQAYKAHVQEFIDKFRYNAKRASLVQSKIKMLEKLPEVKPIEKETESVLRFPETDKLSPPILQLDEVHFYYTKERPIFKNVCVSADMDSRICIVGDNGAGKTTLLKLLLADLSPVSGIRHAHRNLRIEYFSQHHVDQLDMNVSSLELIANRFPGRPVEEYRRQLGSYGISGDLALQSVASLSGGQKSRVAFAVMSMTNPNFLILDEPTNHLDVETIEALGNALNRYQGGVVLVSHDERLIQIICKELWLVGNFTVKTIEGGFNEYRRLVELELQSQL